MAFGEKVKRKNKTMMGEKEFRNYLTSKSNKGLKETLENSYYYSKSDIKAIEEEIKRRKSTGLMRSTAGEKLGV